MTLYRGLHVFSLKSYCVTVMDNWTPLRLFWTRDGAIRWRDGIGDHAHAYRWQPKLSVWVEMSRAALKGTTP